MKPVVLGVLMMFVAVLYLLLIHEVAGAVFFTAVGLGLIKSRKEEGLWG